jgi:hypothetical protein
MHGDSRRYPLTVRRAGEFLLRLARGGAALAETRKAIWIVFGVALGVWWLEAIVLPLNGGRDLGTYLGTYAQLFHSHPVDLGYVLDRMPIASIAIGGLLDFAHGAMAEPVVSLLFAASIVAWFAAARIFSSRAALLVVVVLLLYPGYAILFHELSSDSLFAAGFAGWSLLAVRVLRAPTVRGFAALGLGIGVLALIRPGNQVLAVLALTALLLALPLRRRLALSVAFVVPVLVVVGAWTLNNGLRYGDYTFARGGNATVPFYRAYVTDRIVRPSNGPASRELARDVRRYLLPYEPYRSYHVTLQQFFAQGSPRMQTDLVALSDRLKGFDTNQAWLRGVGLEAVRTHARTYARGVAGTIWALMRGGLYWIPSQPGAPIRTVSLADSTATPGGPTVVIDGRRLPQPSEGEPIPAPHEGGVATPDRSIYTVWTSPTEHHLVFVHPAAKRRYIALHVRMSVLASHLPHRAAHASIARRLNQASHWFPPPFLWLLLALGAFAFRRPRKAAALWLPAVAAAIVVVVSALGLPVEAHYSVPVAPAFVLAAGGALFAPWRAAAAAWAGVADLRRAAGIAIGALALAWALAVYHQNLNGSVAAGQDLGVFLSAASHVTGGASPYAFHGDQTFSYPPLLAYLVAPLNALSAHAAAALWAAILLAATALALWLLGIRDWRCYALTAVYPMTRSSVDLGTVGPLLLLGVAVGWRWRARFVHGGLGLGAAIALKLFLWPLLVWLAVSRRLRALGAAVVVCALCVLVPWAALGFRGLGGYPGLLRHLSRDEATSSYSIVALAVRAHLPDAAAYALSILVTLALLAAAVWVWRRGSLALRDREVVVLTLALAASLAASPIVWMHYFLLLLVPIALTRPRLSWLWFVPLAYYPLGEAAWPAGDARKLAIGLAVTVVVIAATTLPALRREAAAPERLLARFRRSDRVERSKLPEPARH